MIVERISAITLEVTNMARSVQFYNEILGLEIIYGGPHASFTSLRTAGAQDAILNLEQGASSSGWGKLWVALPCRSSAPSAAWTAAIDCGARRSKTLRQNCM